MAYLPWPRTRLQENPRHVDTFGMAVNSPPTDTASELLKSGALRAVYQPIVDLADGRHIGYEALARGPVGSPLEMPDALFRSAGEEGILGSFDRGCRSVALAGALEAGLGSEELLFLNVEPAGLEADGVLDRTGEERLGRISVVIELTERALASRPREVLAAVRWLRERGCRIALDDAGVDRRSLGLMPFVAPDLIKLDRGLTQGVIPDAAAARVINAVRAESERSGAVILAEGIETEHQRRRALAMGATLGQGWLFGRPGDLDDRPRARNGGGTGSGLAALPIRGPETAFARTPFERIADPARCLQGDKRLLHALSRQLEQEAFAVQRESVVVSTFQDAVFFTDRTRRRYERIADGAALVGVIGAGLPDRPGRGIRGAGLSPDDRLRGEWDVVVVGPHFAGAFVARDLGDIDGPGPDAERRFEYFMTYDRGLVIDAARALLHRLVPQA
jgi:EAL domain-containing protein (putative c-di-GMP-specific phosphodiesterase class I)